MCRVQEHRFSLLNTTVLDQITAGVSLFFNSLSVDTPLPSKLCIYSSSSHKTPYYSNPEQSQVLHNRGVILQAPLFLLTNQMSSKVYIPIP